ncbi:MAG: four helix bundle protein [Ruminiclostridium sp.]
MNGAIENKSKKFAVRIINLYKYLVSEKKEYVMSRQILKSGTSIGANVREGEFAQSTPDFISKMSIALKEAGETEYWLELLCETDFITAAQYESMKTDCNEIIRLLISIIKSTKSNNNC